MNAHHRQDAIARLLQENEWLRAEVARLKDVLSPPCLFPREWKLTAKETALMQVIVSREPYAKIDAIYAALYEDRDADIPDEHIVNVMVCKLRKKLALFGIEIFNVHGRGYGLTPDSRALVLTALKG